MHRQGPGHTGSLVVDRLHPSGLEGDLRELLDVEEVRRAQVLVALRFVVSIDAASSVPRIRPSERSSLTSSVPSNSVNLPRTFAIPMCFTENDTLECAASTFQIPVGMTGVVRVSAPVAILTSHI